MLLVLALAIVAAGTLHTVLFEWCTSPTYHSVSWLLPFVVCAAGLKSIGEIFSFSVLATGQSRDLLANRFFTCVLAVVFYAGFAYWYGIVGVVLASLVIAGILLLWNAWLAMRVASNPAITIPVSD